MNRAEKRAAYSTRTTGAAPGATPSGKSAGIMSRLAKAITVTKAAPITTSTGAGTEQVYQPPTIAPPPNAKSAVMQQLDSSVQLFENTATGTGIGAGRTSAPVTVKIKTPGAMLILAGLGAALLLAYAWDRGKL